MGLREPRPRIHLLRRNIRNIHCRGRLRLQRSRQMPPKRVEFQVKIDVAAILVALTGFLNAIDVLIALIK